MYLTLVLFVCRFGAGEGNILLTQVVCNNDTSHILRCSVQGLNRLSTTCNNSQDVAVFCCKSHIIYIVYNTTVYIFAYVYINIEHAIQYVSVITVFVAREPAFQYEGGVRLVGGPYQSEGMLQLFLFNRWYTPCGVTISTDVATAACYQLGYTNDGGATVVYVYCTSL